MNTRFPLACLMIAALPGCALLSPPMEQPVQHDYVGSFFGDRKTSVFSLTPERRTVLVVRKVGTDSSIMVCAEPPSDVAQNLSASVKALAEVSAKSNADKSASAAAEFSREVSSAMTRIFARTQGVQLYRDGSFNLCQAYMNGLIDGPTFVERQRALLAITAALIKDELPQLHTSLRAEATRHERAATPPPDEAAPPPGSPAAADPPGERALPAGPATPRAPRPPASPRQPTAPAEPAAPLPPRGTTP